MPQPAIQRTGQAVVRVLLHGTGPLPVRREHIQEIRGTTAPQEVELITVVLREVATAIIIQAAPARIARRERIPAAEDHTGAQVLEVIIGPREVTGLQVEAVDLQEVIGAVVAVAAPQAASQRPT